MALRYVLSCFAFAVCVTAASGQQAAPLTGDYTGTLGPIHLILHFTQTKANQPAVTLDSPDQGAAGILAGTVTLSGVHLSVAFPSLHAVYTANSSAGNEILTGTWNQGASTRLVLRRREPFVAAAAPSAVDGDWTGALTTPEGSLALLLHIKSDQHGTEFLTFDSPGQHANGLIADNITFARGQLAFDLPAVHGRYTGLLSADQVTLTGKWIQGGEAPLTFNRVALFLPATKPSAADGEWTGTVAAPKGVLHLVLHIRSNRDGTEYVTLDSPDQTATGFEASRATLRGSNFTFDLPQLHGSFSGTVTVNALDGTWTQGSAMAVHLTHPSAVTEQPKSTPVAPITLVNLQAWLNGELKPMLQNPALAGADGIGVAIGIVAHGERRVLTYGAATPSSLFEIGSITKTFTGLLLAQAVTRGTVTLDTPLRELLPSGTAAKPTAGPEITLLSLATHHSGLPRLPGNLHPTDPLNPYANYTLANLYAFLAQHGTTLPPAAPFLYSNVGVALLGQALAAKSALDYPALLQRDILIPLHLTHTFIAIPSEAQPNVLPGHTDDDQPTPAWDLNAFAPAGGIRSDIGDMLTYTEAQLHPPAAFAQAIAVQHQLQADIPYGRIALCWHFTSASGDYWHNGATGGFASYTFFNPRLDLGGVVLVNRSSALADSLGLQIAALLEGRAATPLRH